MRLTSFVAALLAMIGGAVLVGVGWHKSADRIVQAGGIALVTGLALAGVAAGYPLGAMSAGV